MLEDVSLFPQKERKSEYFREYSGTGKLSLINFRLQNTFEVLPADQMRVEGSRNRTSVLLRKIRVLSWKGDEVILDWTSRCIVIEVIWSFWA